MLVESGFAWVPSLAWRMDTQLEDGIKAGDAVSEAAAIGGDCGENIWFTTQPMEEPENP